MAKLVNFEPTKSEQKWIDTERRTANLIELLWSKTSQKQHKDPAFLKAMIRCSWSNGSGSEALLKWRNKGIAKWLEIGGESSDLQVIQELCKKTKLSRREAKRFIDTPTGFAVYYKAFRPEFFRLVKKHALKISKTFELVSQPSRVDRVERKVKEASELILSIPKFRTPRGGQTAMLNGLSPVLACLDPQKKFPVVNGLTRRLLNALGRSDDVSGVQSLTRLIGQHNIADSFCLDVYAASERTKFPRTRTMNKRTRGPRDVGIKSEDDVLAKYVKSRKVIERKHNKLINLFREAVEWRHRIQESEYDALIPDWKNGRKLLIEAKTETTGPLGRTQLRQAIGQLFDYRWRSFHTDRKKVDLALLTPSRPDQDILDLLGELKISALWFEGSSLKGTISL